MKPKDNDKDQDILWPRQGQIEKLREKLHERISREEFEYSWRLEALNRIISVLQVDPVTFHRLWIQPLLAAGISLDIAIACVAQSIFLPN